MLHAQLSCDDWFEPNSNCKKCKPQYAGDRCLDCKPGLGFHPLCTTNLSKCINGVPTKTSTGSYTCKCRNRYFGPTCEDCPNDASGVRSQDCITVDASLDSISKSIAAIKAKIGMTTSSSVSGSADGVSSTLVAAGALGVVALAALVAFHRRRRNTSAGDGAYAEMS